MEHRITHGCGHEQTHYIAGYPAQRERKARWLRTADCRACFIAGRRAVEAETASGDAIVISRLLLADLVGSERQVAWATTIRTRRLAAMVKAKLIDPTGDHACLSVSDAQWWIARRDAADDDLLRDAAMMSADAAGIEEDAVPRAA